MVESKNKEEFYFLSKKLREGLEAEKEVRRLYNNFIKPILKKYLKCKHYDYKKNKLERKKQREGIDLNLSLNLDLDPKTNRFYPDEYKLILLEYLHIHTHPKPKYNSLGWLWTTKSPVIIWLWKTKSPLKSPFFDNGYYLFISEIRSWLLKKYFTKKEDFIYPKKGVQIPFPIKKNNIPSKNEKNGSEWETYNIYIPIEAFPKGCILNIKKTTFRTPLEESFFYKFFKEEVS